MKATLDGIRTTFHIFSKKLKKAIWIVFNALIGSFTRSILKTLNLSKIVSLEQLILQNAIQESANFAINNFKYANYFSKKQEFWINILDAIPSLNSGGLLQNSEFTKVIQSIFLPKDVKMSRFLGSILSLAWKRTGTDSSIKKGTSI